MCVFDRYHKDLLKILLQGNLFSDNSMDDIDFSKLHQINFWLQFEHQAEFLLNRNTLKKLEDHRKKWEKSFKADSTEVHKKLKSYLNVSKKKKLDINHPYYPYTIDLALSKNKIAILIE